MQDDSHLHLLRELLTGTFGRGRRDLNLRQLAMILVTYVAREKQTVRGLAVTLDVSRPAVSRALDRLGALRLISREIDSHDRRSIRVGLTRQGVAYVRGLGNAGMAGWRKATEQANRRKISKSDDVPSAVHFRAGSGKAPSAERRRRSHHG